MSATNTFLRRWLWRSSTSTFIASDRWLWRPTRTDCRFNLHSCVAHHVSTAPILLPLFRIHFKALANSTVAEPPAFDIIFNLRQLGFTAPALQCLQDSPAPLLAAQWRKIHLLLRDQVSVSMLSKPHVFRFLSATPDAKIVSFLELFMSFHFSFELSVRPLLRNTSLAKSRPANLRRKWEFFQNLASDKELLRRRLVSCPRLLSMSTETLQQRHADLQVIGLRPRDLSKAISKWPSILCYNVSDRVLCLQKQGLGIECILKMFVTDPRVLQLPAEILVTRFVRFQEFGLEKNSLELSPAMSTLCTHSTEPLQSRFRWLMTQGFSFGEVGQLLSRCPTIFRLTDSRIAKKLDYLVEVLGRDVSEIIKFPQYLTISLEKRIIPRFSALTELKKNGNLKGELSLATVLTREFDRGIRKKVAH